MSEHREESLMLRTEPSFCIYTADDDKFRGESENEDLIRERMMRSEGRKEVSVRSGERIDTQFSFAGDSFGADVMRMIYEEDESEDVEGNKDNERVSSEFNDLKVDIGEHKGDWDEGCVGFELSKYSDSGDLDKYYEEMIRENPSHPLLLRNYAQYLESKKDFAGAEEFYFRATLADPKDGETLSRYAKLVWELHRDHDRASSYFERAVQAAPEDSHVLAARASFLWEIDEEDDSVENDDRQTMDIEEEKRPASPPLHLAMGLGIDMTADYATMPFKESLTTEEYYMRMVEENPCNPLYLRNYAHFLLQSKGDLCGAEYYYSRAIVLDPFNGPMLSLYAGLVWQLHRDKDRAASHFERAVQASPEDSNVLGSYARFLWEADDETDITDEVVSHQVHYP